MQPCAKNIQKNINFTLPLSEFTFANMARWHMRNSVCGAEFYYFISEGTTGIYVILMTSQKIIHKFGQSTFCFKCNVTSR